MKQICLIFLLILCPLTLMAQSDVEHLPTEKEGDIPPAMPINVQVGRAVHKGDSVPHVILPTLYKYPAVDFTNDKEMERYNRLVTNVKKLLPMAKMVRITIIETYEYLETLPDEKARKEHIKAMERDFKRQYTPIFKKMTRSQGRLLIKLIDRECDQSGLQIATAFIGAFQANFYQGLSFLFGLNLNKKYDPEGDDRFTERVVRMVESGQI